MTTSKPSRPLTADEQQFVKEAEEACFTVEFHESGYPIATGADHNSQCFSGNVEEKRDGDGGATYWLKD